jgi:hypothetical protein
MMDGGWWLALFFYKLLTLYCSRYLFFSELYFLGYGVIMKGDEGRTNWITLGTNTCHTPGSISIELPLRVYCDCPIL